MKTSGLFKLSVLMTLLRLTSVNCSLVCLFFPRDRSPTAPVMPVNSWCSGLTEKQAWSFTVTELAERLSSSFSCRGNICMNTADGSSVFLVAVARIPSLLTVLLWEASLPWNWAANTDTMPPELVLVAKSRDACDSYSFFLHSFNVVVILGSLGNRKKGDKLY